MAIHAGIADALETGNADGGDAKVRIDPVTTLAPIPGNDKCADCAAADTEWASINLGILLCIGCSGAHRSVGKSPPSKPVMLTLVNRCPYFQGAISHA